MSAPFSTDPRTWYAPSTLPPALTTKLAGAALRPPPLEARTYKYAPDVDVRLFRLPPDVNAVRAQERTPPAVFTLEGAAAADRPSHSLSLSLSLLSRAAARRYPASLNGMRLVMLTPR